LERRIILVVVVVKNDKFRGTVQAPGSTKRIRNSGIQRALLEETKIIIKKSKK
jgi:hypothetical protein